MLQTEGATGAKAERCEQAAVLTGLECECERKMEASVCHS